MTTPANESPPPDTIRVGPPRNPMEQTLAAKLEAATAAPDTPSPLSSLVPRAWAILTKDGEVWSLQTSLGSASRTVAMLNATSAARHIVKLQPLRLNTLVSLEDVSSRISELEAEVAALQAAPCGVCAGRPLASGRPCVCGGVGTEQAETVGLRAALFDAEAQVASLTLQRDEEWKRAKEARSEVSASAARARLNDQPPTDPIGDAHASQYGEAHDAQ